MKVSHIKISNILGIEALEFSPGGITEISGSNGAGKTSVLEAIRSTLRGGSDATLLRQGATSGEVVLVLDDGTSIRKRVTEKGATVDVTRGDAVLKKPASVIAQLSDALSVNPIEFLRAPEKQRVEALLQCMPVEVDEGRINQITGTLLRNTITGTGLDALEAARKQIYDNRTGVNRSLKDKEATINQLRATLPAEPLPEPPSDAQLQEQQQAIDATRDAEVARIQGKLGDIREQAQGRIEALHQQIDALRQEITREEREMQETAHRAASAIQDTQNEHQLASADIKRELAQIAADSQQRARYAQTAETIEGLAADLGALKAESEACTGALDGLESYKAELMAALPISGLEIREGQVFREGIAFDRLNTAQQVDIAIEIAKLRAGELGLICVDGLELLDHAAYEAFRERAEASGLQLVVSRVSDGPLEVKAA